VVTSTLHRSDGPDDVRLHDVRDYAVNIGFPSDFLLRWLKSYGIGFCIAVPAIYLLAPFARKIAALLVEPPPKN